MSNNFTGLKNGDYVIFKKNHDDPEECAKIKSVENGGYEIKQYFNKLLVTGFINYDDIIRIPEKEEISKIKGSKEYDLSHKTKFKSSIIGFKSNLMNDKKNNNNTAQNNIRGLK